MKINNPSLIAAFVAASYLTRISNRRPNPSPPQEPQQKQHRQQSLSDSKQQASEDADSEKDHSQIKDFLRYVAFLPNLREWVFIILQSAHIILTARYPPSAPAKLYPDPSQLNPRYFTWNAFTASWLVVLCTAASVRLAAFRELGRNFTFELARPAKLVTSGLYAYVQHPSYPADILVTISNYVLFANPDGWVGTFLPREMRELWMRYRWLSYILLGCAGTGVFVTRVKQEEDMLRRAYGEEWEEWHRKTARFVPGVF